MSNTGYKILTYRDTNPYSPTYLQTRTEKVFDEDSCPNNSPNWVEIKRECNKIIYTPSGVAGNNGKATVTYQDMNIDSPTYNTTKTEVTSDLSNCPLPNTSSEWEIQSSECEEK